MPSFQGKLSDVSGIKCKETSADEQHQSGSSFPLFHLPLFLAEGQKAGQLVSNRAVSPATDPPPILHPQLGDFSIVWKGTTERRLQNRRMKNWKRKEAKR